MASHLSRSTYNGAHTVNDKRPVNLDFTTMRLPITAWTSIAHRASGVFIFVGMAFLIWALDASLESPESFAGLQECMASPLAKFVMWTVVSGLIYHSVAGVKHLIMDAGVGETMEGGIMGSRLVIATSVVLILLAGLWIW
jgi:succinate dehydrogenase / fumarate reductase cytochrome b subunit